MKVLKVGVIPEEDTPLKLQGECDNCGCVVECMEDEEGVRPHYYGDPAWMVECPTCQDIMWVVEKE